MTEQDYPPLPEPDMGSITIHAKKPPISMGYSIEAMRTYSDAAVAADRAARGVPDGWRNLAEAIVYTSEHGKPEIVEMALMEGSPLVDAARELLSESQHSMLDEMDAIASKFAHKLALDLECVLSDYSGKWWDTAIKTIGEYRSAMNAIHERESPTFMGEPRL